MIKNLTTLEVAIGSRVYKLLCEGECPIGEVHDALSQMKAYVVNYINEVHKAQVAQEEAAKAKAPIIEPSEVV